MRVKVRIGHEGIERALRRLIINLELEPRSEIVVPAFSTTNLGEIVAGAGHVPVYADVDDRGLLDPRAVLKKVRAEFSRDGEFWRHRRRGGRLAGLCIVHPGGLTPDLEAIWELAKELGLVIIDDARGALGARAWAGGRWVEAGAAGEVGVASGFGEAYAYASSPTLLEGLEREEGAETPGYLLRRAWREAVRKVGIGEKALAAPTWCEPAGEFILVVGGGSQSLWPKYLLERKEGRLGYRKGSCPMAEHLAETLEPVRLPKPRAAELPASKALAQSIG